jgi:Tfp pilus assembly protein PilF
MKKLVLIALASLSVGATFAQNAAVQSARNYLREKDFENAKKYIDQALADPSTKDKAKTWYTKGDIYMQMAEDPNYAKATPPPQVEAIAAYMKVIEIDPDYEREAMNSKLLNIASAFYNIGVGLYRANNYEQSYMAFQGVMKIHDMEKGKRFKVPAFDTLAATTREMMGYSQLYQKKYAEALPVFLAMKNDPVVKNPSIYISLSDIYSNLDKRDEQIKVITEGRAAYPNDANLRNEEINFYIVTERTTELTAKLEEAIKQEPNNAELHHTLANIYNTMANPKTGSKPANVKELLTKAEASYKKAVSISPDNAEFNFNTSVLYYMQAYDVVQAMNNLTESAEDMKKYNALSKDKDALFKAALPYAEKAYAVLSPKAKDLKGKEKDVYNSTVNELFELYTKLNMTDKSAEFQRKKNEL